MTVRRKFGCTNGEYNLGEPASIKLARRSEISCAINRHITSQCGTVLGAFFADISSLESLCKLAFNSIRRSLVR